MEQYHQDQDDQNLLENYKCIVPCTIKMLNEIQKQIIPNLQGVKVDQVSLIGRVTNYQLIEFLKIIKPLQFGTSPKGFAQVIMTVEDVSYFDQIQIKITQYETKKDILESIMKKNNIAGVNDFENQCFKFIITIKQAQKKKLLYEAKSLERIVDFNKITLHFLQVIRTYCDRQFGQLQGQLTLISKQVDEALKDNLKQEENNEDEFGDLQNYLY